MGPTTTVDNIDTNDENESAEELRRDIEATRAEMSETINAIQDKVNPETVKAQIKENVKEEADALKTQLHDATIGRAEKVVHNASESARGAGDSLLEMIKDNPIPAAMVGIGLGWLVYASRQGHHSHPRFRRTQGYAYDEQTGAYRPHDYATGVEGAVHHLADKASHVAEDVQHKVGDLTEAVRDKAGNLVHHGHEHAEDLREESHHLGHEARHRVQYVTERGREVMDESPLVGGAIALALGAAVGFILPETRKEEELMGPASSRIVHDAKDIASDVVGRAQEVASTALDAAKRAGEKAVAAGKEEVMAEYEVAKEEVKTEAQAAKAEVEDNAKSKMSGAQNF